ILEPLPIGAIEVDADAGVDVVRERAGPALGREHRLDALRRELAVVRAADQLLLGARRVDAPGEDRVVELVRAGPRRGEQPVEVALPDEAVDLAPRPEEPVAIHAGDHARVKPELEP